MQWLPGGVLRCGGSWSCASPGAQGTGSVQAGFHNEPAHSEERPSQMRLDATDVALCVSDSEPEGAHAPLPTSPPIAQTSLLSFPTFQALLDAFADEYGNTI
jgi:hypothetical protein